MSENSLNNAVTMRPDRGASLGRIDQYELIRELGGGGFGCVYLARDTVAGIDVAVKGLPPLVRLNKEELENVRQNFALVSRLYHPNIAAALHFQKVQSAVYNDDDVKEKLRVFNGDPLVVMQYAPGVTLSQWRKQFSEGKVPLDKAIEITRQIASALDYAHKERIIHRDIKPANVMIETLPDRTVTARVLDFGLAAEICSSMGRLSLNVTDKSGTRHYMAPEQWSGKKQSKETDQYSLAALFYELILGEVPFASVFDTGDTILMKTVVENDPPEIPSDLPKPVRLALAKALAKKREDRFASCLEFVDALEGGMAQSKTASRSEVARGLRASSRAVILVALAFLGIGAGVWYWQNAKSKDVVRVEPGHKVAAENAAKERLAREAEEARLKAEREAAEERVRKAVLEKIEAERKEAAKNAAKERLAREAKEAKLKAERDAAEERARKAELEKIEAERKEAAEKAAKERLAREAEEAKLKAERDAAEEHARKAESVRIEAERKEAAEKSAKERLAREAEVERLKAERDAAEERARKAEQARIEMERKVREKSSVPKSYGEAKDQPIKERSREPKKGDTKTLTLPGGATMEMIYVVPGMFEWRPEVGKGYATRLYETRRRVRLTKGFWLGKYEVTQSQWESVMGDNPSEYKKWFFSSSTNYPVENVSWHDCQEFIKKVNSVVGCGARLPTEAEWEYACRTGTKTAFNWGSDLPIKGAANCIYRDYKGDWHSVGHPVAVGSYEPNAWGFHDMHGNVNEWCQDRYEYWGTIREKIVEIVDPIGARVGVERVIRGGAWKYSYTHSSMRHYGLPDKKSEATGFRLACSVLP